MLDTHCHVYKEEMNNYIEIIEECNRNSISMIINAVDIESSKEIIDLSKKYNNVYASIGINYDSIDKAIEKDLVLLEDLIKKEKVVALGEIGLDYYWTKDNKEKQITFFKKQLELAKKYDLPVIVHARESIQDVYDILKESNVRKGSLHCFSGSLEMAKEFIKLGFKIGVDGPITYKNNKKGIEIIKNIDLKDILIETDSPYLSPEPNRGKQNSPLNLKYIVEKISDIKEISKEEVIKVTTNNAKELFRI
ncbi:MAG: TatD family hydrolase [Bacilli bacterium]|nr:TatD family hydrolase [Bacilli bacterium]